MIGVRTVVAAVGLLVIVVSSASGTGAADGTNQSPLAEAGLDQEVPVNATVYLDATGSSDPDGSITRYEWSVERPDGSTTTPACRTCARTRFQVHQAGQYTVTVTVTDDAGAEASDTLRVEVDEPDEPTVDIAGPTDVLVNESVEYTATVDAGATELAQVQWEFDDNATTRGLGGMDATDQYSPAFASDETREVTVTVMDRLGRTATATREVEISVPEGYRLVDGSIVEKRPGGAAGGGGGGGGAVGSSNCYIPQSDDPEDYDYYCNNDLKLHDGQNQEMTIVDTDDDGNYTYGGVQIDSEYATDTNEMTLSYSKVRNLTGMRIEDVGPNNDPEPIQGQQDDERNSVRGTAGNNKPGDSGTNDTSNSEEQTTGSSDDQEQTTGSSDDQEQTTGSSNSNEQSGEPQEDSSEDNESTGSDDNNGGTIRVPPGIDTMM